MSTGSEEGYLTPDEAIRQYPQLTAVHGITKETLGLLLKHHVLWGRYESGKRLALIQEDSLICFIDYLNSLLDKQRIPVNGKPKRS